MPRTHIDTLTLWRQLRHHLSTQRPVWTRWTTHPAPECHGWRPWPNNFCLPGRKTRFGQRVSFWFTGRTNLTYKKITLEVRRFTRGKDCIFSADFTLHHKNIKQVFAFIDDPRDACPWLAMKRRASFSNEQKKKTTMLSKKNLFHIKTTKTWHQSSYWLGNETRRQCLEQFDMYCEFKWCTCESNQWHTVQLVKMYFNPATVYTYTIHIYSLIFGVNHASISEVLL